MENPVTVQGVGVFSTSTV